MTQSGSFSSRRLFDAAEVHRSAHSVHSPIRLGGRSGTGTMPNKASDASHFSQNQQEVGHPPGVC